MKIAIGNDHMAVDMKNHIKKYLEDKGHTIVNFGTDTPDRTDYPIYAKKVADSVVSKECELGILICGTGIGISIAANRVKGIRAAVLYNEDVARLTREHNNANIAVFGGRMQKFEDVVKYFDIFKATDFSNENRHQRRICALDE